MVQKPILIINHATGESSYDWTLHKEGAYVFSLQALMKGRIECYKLSRGLGGVCNLIDYSSFGERLSYMNNFD